MNRIICPKGISIPIDDFSTRFILKSDLRSVTVENQGKYWVYEFEGPLSDMVNVKLLLSWKNDYTASSKPQACILCTDLSLDLVTIQRFYHVRWNIETGYRYFKELLGFDQYQLDVNQRACFRIVLCRTNGTNRYAWNKWVLNYILHFPINLIP
jgi:hypothetical protein